MTSNMNKRARYLWKHVVIWFKAVGTIFNTPRLHARIHELEMQLQAEKIISASQPNFHTIKQPFDASGVIAKIADKAARDMAPMLGAEALKGLKDLVTVMKTNTYADAGRTPSGYIAAIGGENHAQIIQVEVRIPELRHTFQVYLGYRSPDEAA